MLWFLKNALQDVVSLFQTLFLYIFLVVPVLCLFQLILISMTIRTNLIYKCVRGHKITQLINDSYQCGMYFHQRRVKRYYLFYENTGQRQINEVYIYY